MASAAGAVAASAGFKAAAVSRSMAFSKRDAIKLTWPATQPDAGGHAVATMLAQAIFAQPPIPGAPPSPPEPPDNLPPAGFGQTPADGLEPDESGCATFDGGGQYTFNVGASQYTLTIAQVDGDWTGTFDDGNDQTEDGVNISPGTYADVHGVRIYVGTRGDDTYASEFTGPNIILGFGGKDHLTGNESRDFIFSGSGTGDKLYGQDGDDFLSLSESEGNGLAVGGAGSDHIIGSSANDTLYGDDGASQWGVGAGLDSIWTGLGEFDTVDGGPGSDTIYVTAANGSFVGGGSGDTFYIYAGGGTYWGDYKEDSWLDEDDYNANPERWKSGFNGDSQKDARPGQDYFHVYRTDGACDFYCGPEGDTVHFGGSYKDDIWGQGGGDVLDGGPDEDEIIGGDGADMIYGNSGDDKCYGNDEEDQIWGGSGDDKLSGGEMRDWIWGDLGAIELGAVPEDGLGYNDVIDGKDGNDYLCGSWGNDDIHCGEGTDIAFGEEGDDKLHGDRGYDYLYGNTGNDTLIDHSVEIDTLMGGVGADKLSCWDNKVVNTSNGVDIVRGDDGADHGDKFWLDDADDWDADYDPELTSPTLSNWDGEIPERPSDWGQVPAVVSVPNDACK
ncbi:MAG: hypothetical protein K8I27_14200, partial [Planctomycetes bacterium]|nr:hypothetical protein [Planctomycetota bacterium]